ncbi:MAG: FtsX-like permease family protein, partial [Ruminococcaceae bacterium]|nr:FtsX-like permease family protein [Oscillospiraceae bacterium]
SAWIPSKKATKVSAVEAIRQNRDIRTKAKQVKVSKLTQRIFGLSGILAVKYYKRSKKKYRSTVISLFMSIVLFVSASAFTNYLTDSVTGIFSSVGYDIFVSTEPSDMGTKTADDILELLRTDPNVNEAVYTKELYFDNYIDKSFFTNEYISSTQQEELEKVFVYGCAYFINDSEFDKLIDKYGLDREDYYNKEDPMGIAIGRNTIFNGEKYQTVNTLNSRQFEIECSYIKAIDGYYDREIVQDSDGNIISVIYQSVSDENDILELSAAEVITTVSIKSNKVIMDTPFYLQRSSFLPIKMIYPISVYDHMINGYLKNDDDAYRYYMTSSDHKASYDNIKEMLSENGLNSRYITDNAANVENEKNIINIIKVFSYGFIVLISMIAAANVFNTISTNISLRRREFAMLKSVGMDDKSFKKIMNYECLLYGSKALVFGIPFSCIITFFVFLAVSKGYETVFYLPWGAIAIAILSVFFVVFVSMLYSMNKIKDDNPIDLVKNENL